MSNIKELRSLSKQELESKLDEVKKELMKENAQIATGTTPKSPGKVRELKKTVARILTIRSAPEEISAQDKKDTKKNNQESSKKQEDKKEKDNKKTEEING